MLASGSCCGFALRMRFLIVTLSALGFGLFPLSAKVGVSPLIQWLDTDFDEGAGYGIRGFAGGGWGQIELEFVRSSLNSTKEVQFQGLNFTGTAEADANLFFLNYRFPYHLTERFAVFGGAGAGATWVDFEYREANGLVEGTGDDVVVSYQLFAGVEYYILPNLSVSGGYKFISFGDSTVEDLADLDVEIDIVTGDSSAWELAVNLYF